MNLAYKFTNKVCLILGNKTPEKIYLAKYMSNNGHLSSDKGYIVDMYNYCPNIAFPDKNLIINNYSIRDIKDSRIINHRKSLIFIPSYIFKMPIYLDYIFITKIDDIYTRSCVCDTYLSSDKGYIKNTSLEEFTKQNKSLGISDFMCFDNKTKKMETITLSPKRVMPYILWLNPLINVFKLKMKNISDIS